MFHLFFIFSALFLRTESRGKVQENIVILNVTIFCVQTKECQHHILLSTYYTFLELKGYIFSLILQEAKEIQKILKSTL